MPRTSFLYASGGHYVGVQLRHSYAGVSLSFDHYSPARKGINNLRSGNNQCSVEEVDIRGFRKEVKKFCME